jgi:hypothetical protein
MTAEVVIMNAVGVSLAADSAVTIGSDAKKIFTSTDKLFHLTKGQPVGIMIHGNAQFLGVPWETIVKEYRPYIGAKPLPTIEAYAAHFLGYLTRHARMFPSNVQDEHARVLIERHLLRIRGNRPAKAS